MSIYESSVTNPKKQLEFYKQLSEQLQQENQQLKEKVNQLETNIDEAIEELTYMSTDVYVEDYDIREKHYNLLSSILERGKE